MRRALVVATVFMQVSPARASDAAPVAAEVRAAAVDFFHLCWTARANNPALLERCYAPEGTFRAVRAGAQGETIVPRAQWIAEKGAAAASIRNSGRLEINESPIAGDAITVEPIADTSRDAAAGAGALRLSFVSNRARGARFETVRHQLVLGSGTPGPSPVILSEREEVLVPVLPGRVGRLPVRAAPACAASADLTEGTNLVITGAYDRFSAALAAARRQRRRGRPAEIVAGRWLVPAEEKFVIAAGAFAERDQAERRAAHLGGRVAAVAATGPGGPIPAWGLAGAARVDGLVGALEVRDQRVVMWSGPRSTGWRLGPEGLTLEAVAAAPDASAEAEAIDPYSAATAPGLLGPRFPGLNAALGDGPTAPVVRYDDRRDELQAVETAGGAERILWTLPLGARERLVQVFPRRGGLYLRFDDTLYWLRLAAAGTPAPRMGKLCGKLTADRKSARNGAVLLPAPAAGGDPLRLDTTDGTFELWAPVPSVVKTLPDETTFRCGRGQTARSDAPTSALLTELGARVELAISCQ